MIGPVRGGLRILSPSIFDSGDSLQPMDSSKCETPDSIPEYLESPQTLQYPGFTPSRASYIWAVWETMVVETGARVSEPEFCRFAFSAVSGSKYS